MQLLLLLVVCVTKSFGQCTDGAVRLGGNSTNRVSRDLEGTVEVCALGQWGTIAALDYSYFGAEEATVVCRQLGLSDKGARAVYSTYTYMYYNYYWQYTYTAYYGAGSGSVVLTCGLYCSGNETSVSLCSYSSNYAVSCYNSHMYDIGVRCQQAPALVVSINVAPNQSTTMYAGMAVTFWCNVGYSDLTGAERFFWRSSCVRDCTVWGQTSQLVTIDYLKPSDSGNYTCTVTRADVSRSASVIINVIVPNLVVSSFPVVVYALEEPGYDMINLTCIATKPSGVLPSVVFVWSKCGTSVDSDPRIFITSRQVSTITSTSNLLLQRASVQDSSVYECKAVMTFPDLSTVSNNQTFQVSISAPTSLLFQLHVIGVFRCQSWITNRPEGKLSTISMTLATAVNNLCSCGFGVDRVTKAAFSCYGNTNTVLYRAQLNATATANSSDLLLFVDQWVTHEDTTLTVAGTRLYLDSECPVYIRSFKDDPCSASEMGNVTQLPPTSATPRGTVGRVPTTMCPPSSATTSQPPKGSGVATLPDSVPTGTSEGAVNTFGAGEGQSFDIGIVLVVVGSLIVIFGVGLFVAALVVFMRAKSKGTSVYQVRLKKDWEEKEPFRVDLPDQGQQQ